MKQPVGSHLSTLFRFILGASLGLVIILLIGLTAAGYPARPLESRSQAAAGDTQWTILTPQGRVESSAAKELNRRLDLVVNGSKPIVPLATGRSSLPVKPGEGGGLRPSTRDTANRKQSDAYPPDQVKWDDLSTLHAGILLVGLALLGGMMITALHSSGALQPPAWFGMGQAMLATAGAGLWIYVNLTASISLILIAGLPTVLALSLASGVVVLMLRPPSKAAAPSTGASRLLLVGGVAAVEEAGIAGPEHTRRQAPAIA